MHTSWTGAHAADLLRQGVWFAEQPPWFQERVIERSVILHVPSGCTIGRPEGIADGAYAILEGQVNFLLPVARDIEAFCFLILPGGWFGYGATMRSSNWGMRRIAARATTVLHLPKAEFDSLGTERPESYRCWAELGDEFSWKLVTYLIHAHNLPVRQRIALAFLNLAAHGAKVDDGVEIKVTLTQADLASLLGVTRQYVNRFTSEFTRAGIIDWSRNLIVIRDEAALRAFSTV